jgi:hypothetical protein
MMQVSLNANLADSSAANHLFSIFRDKKKILRLCLGNSGEVRVPISASHCSGSLMDSFGRALCSASEHDFEVMGADRPRTLSHGAHFFEKTHSTYLLGINHQVNLDRSIAGQSWV